MNAINIDFAQFVQIQHSQPVTTSDFIAKAFNKRHDDVLRKISELSKEIKDKFFLRNFAEIEIPRKVGFGQRLFKAYELTKDGFMLLVMGFTGKDAMAIKIAYIEAFNAMAEKIKQMEAQPVQIDHAISEAQAHEISQAVLARCARTGESYQKVYSGLHDYMGIDSYHSIPVSMFQTALKYLGSIENAPELFSPQQIEPQEPQFSEKEISQFAVVTYYLDKATRQLKELSEPLKALGAQQQGVEARTLWLESQGWLRDSRAAIERVQPQIKDNYFREHTAETLYRMDRLACII